MDQETLMAAVLDSFLTLTAWFMQGFFACLGLFLLIVITAANYGLAKDYGLTEKKVAPGYKLNSLASFVICPFMLMAVASYLGFFVEYPDETAKAALILNIAGAVFGLIWVIICRRWLSAFLSFLAFLGRDKDMEKGKARREEMENAGGKTGERGKGGVFPEGKD